MIKYLITIIVLAAHHIGWAQDINKENYNYTPQYNFYDIIINDISPDNKWITFYKVYSSNADSLFIVNKENPQKQFVKVKAIGHMWIEDHLISKYSDKTTVHNLKADTTINLPSSQELWFLKDQNILLLFNGKDLLIYSVIQKKVLQTLQSIKKVFVSDDSVYILKKNESRYQLYTWNLYDSTLVYETSNFIDRLVMLRDKSKFISLEKNKEHLQELVYCNLNSSKYSKFNTDNQSQFSYISAYERLDGSLVVSTEMAKVKPPKIQPDIWYTSDKNLFEKFKNLSGRQYLWTPEENIFLKLGTEKLNRIVDIKNEQYFLAFSFSELQDYTSQQTPSAIYRFDKLNGTYEYLDTVCSKVTFSPDGNYLIYKSGKDWTLFNITALSKESIEDRAFFQPYFADDNCIYFDGDDGLWKYNFSTRKLESVYKNAKGDSRIINSSYNTLFSNYLFEIPFVCRTINPKEILFEVVDEKTGLKSIHQLWLGKLNTILPQTEHRVMYQSKASSQQNFLFTEENFNMPKQIVNINDKNRKIIHRSNTFDRSVSKIKIKTITYKNNDNLELKGILYYPLDFDENQKYPMVVHIYQVQSPKKNIYPTVNYSELKDGFNIRSLIEKGYFVYLPDIVFGKKGTGLSALDCVNKSLDALSGIHAIDFSKVALIGHSHGGYLTNFIATRSNRFATYISGAGNSDIIRSYFSFNNNFYSPFYWQFENGQYEMGIPFSENKNLYFNNNPIYNVEKVNNPVLLWTGKRDENIDWEQTMEFYIGLKRNNKDAAALFYENEGHSMSDIQSSQDLHNRILDWLDYFLKNIKSIPWLQSFDK